MAKSPKCLPPLKVGIIGGSGLDDPNILHNQVLKCVNTPYGRPSDMLMHGEIGGVDVVILPRHGRKHSLTPAKINYRANIWALKDAGCTHVIATNACGSLQEDIHPGELVIIDSFIDRTQGRKQTFFDGEAGSPTGVLHMPMHPAFSPSLRETLCNVADELKLTHHKNGTCVVIEGPRFSSHAESTLFQSWGGSVINMTMVPEVVLARESGLLYSAIAMATDYCAWRLTEESVNVSEVVATFKKNVSNIVDLITKTIPKLAESGWEDEYEALQQLIKSSFQNH